jgi:hypothetical protein
VIWKKSWIVMVLMMFIIVLTIAGAAMAGKSFDLLSGVSTTAVTGSAMAVDGHFKSWNYGVYCSNTMNAASPATVTVEGSVDGTHFDTMATYTWPTTAGAAAHAMFQPSTNIPVRKIRGRWSTMAWTSTAGSCSLTGLGVL